jgi:PEP-CTERM motif
VKLLRSVFGGIMTKFTMLLGGIALFAVSPVSAAVLFNASPTGTVVVPNATSFSRTVNFLVKFNLASASTVTGFDIWMASPFATLGDGLRVKIRNDTSSGPAVTNLFSFTDQIDAVASVGNDISRVSTNFAGISLAAGNYWFGVSGEPFVKTWSTYSSLSTVTSQRQLNGNTIVPTLLFGNLPFRVNGTTGAVPEPATWMMMLVGFGIVGSAMRGRMTKKVSFS